MNTLRAFALFGLAPALSACDSDGTSPGDGLPARATFDVTVAGDQRLSFSGLPLVLASFAVADPDAPADTLIQSGTIALASRGDAIRTRVDLFAGGDLSAGTVTINGLPTLPRGPSARFSTVLGGESVVAEAVSGTLTITQSDDERIAGRFRFVTEQAITLFFSPDDGPTARPFEVTVKAPSPPTHSSTPGPARCPSPFPVTSWMDRARPGGVGRPC